MYELLVAFQNPELGYCGLTDFNTLISKFWECAALPKTLRQEIQQMTRKRFSRYMDYFLSFVKVNFNMV
ncbi:MAG: hypothetical protein ABIS01_09200, partial [Ferruginibacter sp.]